MSTYTLRHSIRIGNIQVNKIISVEITKTIESFTNTAIITMPKRLIYNNQIVFTDFDSLLFKKGYPVTINLMYVQGAHIHEPDNSQFSGFINEIEITENEVKIHCEDYMYYAKKSKLNFSAPSISLSDLGNRCIQAINSILPPGVSPVRLNTDGLNLTLYNFKAEKCSAVEVLQLLKDDYLLDSYFVNNNLYIGINFTSIGERSNSDYTFSTYPRELLKQKSKDTFLFLIDTNNLKYKKADDIKFSITAKVFTSNSEFHEVKSGDPDGEQRTFIFSGNYSDTEVQSLVDNQIKRLKYDGFQRGSSFKTFGLPQIELLSLVSFDGIGQIRFYDNESFGQTNRKKVYEKSTYLCDAVKTTYDSNGFRQEVGISNRINVPSDNVSVAKKIEGANLIKF